MINNYKEILIAISAILGWLFAVFQFIMNKKDRKQNRKFETYSGIYGKS
jgi:preprotein translocase subunit YajC